MEEFNDDDEAVIKKFVHGFASNLIFFTLLMFLFLWTHAELREDRTATTEKLESLIQLVYEKNAQFHKELHEERQDVMKAFQVIRNDLNSFHSRLLLIEERRK